MPRGDLQECAPVVLLGRRLSTTMTFVPSRMSLEKSCFEGASIRSNMGANGKQNVNIIQKTALCSK